MLGAQVSPQGDHAAEFAHLLRTAWAAYHRRKRLGPPQVASSPKYGRRRLLAPIGSTWGSHHGARPSQRLDGAWPAIHWHDASWMNIVRCAYEHRRCATTAT